MICLYSMPILCLDVKSKCCALSNHKFLPSISNLTANPTENNNPGVWTTFMLIYIWSCNHNFGSISLFQNPYVEPGPARMTSITTTSLPQFFAVLSRPRSHHHHYHRRHNHDHNHQLCHCHQQHRRHNHQRCHHRQEARPIGPEGGVVASPLLPEVNFVVMVITIIMMNMILVIVIFILIILTLVITSSSWSSWSLPRIKPPLRLNVSSHRELWQNRSLLDFQFAPYPKISPTTFSHRLFEKWIWDIRRMVWKQKDPNCLRLGLPPQYVQWSPGGGSSTGSRSDRWTMIKEPSNCP